MLLDLLLAIGHHLLMFALFAAIAAEIVLMRPGLRATRIERIGRIDAVYGAVAALIIVVGIGRVFFGIKGSAYYLENPVFWAKMVAFAAVGILSIQPTRRILAWRRALRSDPGFTPPADEINRMRRLVHIEATVFLLIPIFAAAMARGYGL